MAFWLATVGKVWQKNVLCLIWIQAEITHYLLIACSGGILAETRVTADIHQTPHITLRLFTPRKAYKLFID